MNERNGRLQSQDTSVQSHVPDIPLYRIVSKLRPWRLGSRNEFFSKSQVPSPTVKVLDEYELDPGGERLFAMEGNTCWRRPARSRPRKDQEVVRSSFLSQVQNCTIWQWQELDEELVLRGGSRLANKKIAKFLGPGPGRPPGTNGGAGVGVDTGAMAGQDSGRQGSSCELSFVSWEG